MKINDIIYIVPKDTKYQAIFHSVVNSGLNLFWIPEKEAATAFIRDYSNAKTIILSQDMIDNDFTAIQRFKFSCQMNNCKIIFLANSESDGSKAKFIGADYIVLKPFTSDGILFAIKNIISMNESSLKEVKAIRAINNINPSLLLYFDKIVDLSRTNKNLRLYIYEFDKLPKDKEKEIIFQIMRTLKEFVDSQIPFKNRFLIFPFTDTDLTLMLFYPDTFSKNLFLSLTSDIENIIADALKRYNAEYSYGFADSLFEVSAGKFEITIYSLLKKAYEVIWDTKGGKNSIYKDEFNKILETESIWTEYQPIIALSDYSIFGYEALSRGPVNTIWQNPEYLFEMGFKFDRILELEETCTRKNITYYDITNNVKKLFINIHPSTAEILLSKIDFFRELNLDIELIIEITERKLIQDFKKFKELFGRLRSSGIKIALDDVGSGYSSLQYLIELDVDYIKIDRTLISEIHKNFIKKSVVSSLVDIANDIDCKIIAEGIESSRELKIVQKLNIDYGQGFLFAHPSVKPTPTINYLPNKR
jgi:EAL domain-containing protein (putative c-di-GMP-specific phosphodiesterase class I)/DNA-binding response OmpR family regulator